MLLVSLLVAKVTGAVPLIVVATIGNTLGGMTNLVLGRILPQPKPRTGTLTALRWLQRYGPAALLLSWVPVIGDVLCVAAHAVVVLHAFYLYRESAALYRGGHRGITRNDFVVITCSTVF